MRYVLLTYVGADHAADWEASSAAEKQAEIDAVMAWFGEHGAAGRIVGGEELGRPEDVRTVRRRGVSDGPFVETKELLGGFIVVEVESEAQALELARTWPGLRSDTDRVEVWPVGSSPDEAAAQAAAEAAAA
jgi:hypothetical protein